MPHSNSWVDNHFMNSEITVAEDLSRYNLSPH